MNYKYLLELNNQFEAFANSIPLNRQKEDYVAKFVDEMAAPELRKVASYFKLKESDFDNRVMALLICISAVFYIDITMENDYIIKESFECINTKVLGIYLPHIIKIIKLGILQKDAFLGLVTPIDPDKISFYTYIGFNDQIKQNLIRGERSPYKGVKLLTEAPDVYQFFDAAYNADYDQVNNNITDFIYVLFNLKIKKFELLYKCLNISQASYLKMKAGDLRGVAASTVKRVRDFINVTGICMHESHECSIFSVLRSSYKRQEIAMQIVQRMIDGEHPFMKNGLFEFSSCEEASTATIRMTEFLADILFGDQAQFFAASIGSRNCDVIANKSIKKKELFYNTKNQHDIDTLFSLVEDKNFKKITHRLQLKGLPQGLAILLYGPPGTGKTETVLQLAKATNRDVIKVDISSIRDKWVGETEKNIKAIFKSYKSKYSDKANCPILFLNEADALITKRTSIGTNASVDKMENAMQNIILDELENFTGICIATTNLIKNMDAAFERRFLYKIKLENPTSDVKKKIWQSKINLSEDIADYVSKEYDFSGGQIDNVVRKISIDEILFGKKLDKKSIKSYCDNEKWSEDNRKAIGFGSN